MKWKQVMLIVAISAVSAIGSVLLYNNFSGKKVTYSIQNGDVKIPANYAGFTENGFGAAEPVDFTKTAAATVPAVVHIKTKIAAKKVSNQLPRNGRNSSPLDDMFQRFFGDDLWGGGGQMMQPEQRASGSGVIISEDGYIVTNNHVVSDGGSGVADEITVTLNNKKTYKAKVVGRDASTDLAVLKIDGSNLPFLLYGNSDNVKLGQWALAVGYPFSLETTVTAGIISAKGRNIGINSQQSKTPIESFIQTDAAVNPGNSGGPLVNTDGQVIGINSAIYAPNGTYAGYSFAIPVNLVKKVVNDLIKFGDVKRPYLGVSADQDKIDESNGAFVGDVAKEGAAAAMGLKKGDLITKINEVPVNSWTELQATVSSYNVGDKITVAYKRDGKDYTGSAVLKEKPGTYEVATSNVGSKLGADLETVSKETAQKNDIEGGVVVKKIISGGPFSKTKMETGFIITSVNGIDVNSVEDLNQAIRSLRGETLQLEGIYPGYMGVYRYPLVLQNEE